MTRIVFRADAGAVPEIGTGHMVRALQLADALLESPAFGDAEIRFATRGSVGFEQGRRWARERGFRLVDGEELEPNTPGELRTLLDAAPSAVILDRLATSEELVKGLREAGIRVWTFDDLGSGRAHAHVSIQALLQNVEPADNLHLGYRYLVLPERSVVARPTRPVASSLLACFGGYDARGLRDVLLSAITEIEHPLRVDLLLGSVGDDVLREYREAADRIAERQGHHIRVNGRVSDLSSFLQDSDMAVVSGGMVAFECARFGVPAIGLAQYEHQLENLCRLQEEGCLATVDHAMAPSPTSLASVIDQLLEARGVRKRMSAAGRRLIDGHGLQRVVRILTEDYRALA